MEIREDDDIEVVEQTPPPAPPEEPVDEDKPLTAATDETDEAEREREVIRERRRQEKQERKERRDAAIRRDKVELDFLRRRNDELERRITGVEQKAQQNDVATIEVQLKAAMTEVEMAEKVIAKAVAAGNGEDVTKAMRYRDQAMAKAQQLNAARQSPPKASPKAPEVDPEVLHHAREFMDENSWYDPNAGDEASSVVLAIDQALSREGLDPRSEDYWVELRRRAAKRLPEKFEAPTAPVRTPRGGPPVGGGKTDAPPSAKREFYISPERKQALVEAGVWDDPVLRQKYVKRYAEYDRANKA